MVVVVSGSGTTVVGGLEGTVVVIVGSGAGTTIVGRLAGTLVVVGRSAVSGMLNGTGNRTGPVTKNKFINWLIDQ